ncbi:MAG: hypothetical protein DCC59_16670 [Chloroflexi bacterium]|nr:DUF433 domain-containing protein [Chloroflexi bacterium CFX1]MCK6566507.1 DUF433 domain-containing protein [Anaerolineales bacterium]MCQ3952044.1 hypothetical protein [Chloroflexota bacterium]MDL1918095.1 DUF433 domain-containing protein [Chloroflexi bacterium CFX5]NUQ59624.1 DUF433 domain-containing protein [Anaerolineales bacterium]
MATSLNIQPLNLPIAPGKNGVVRVSGTRVTLDTVIHAFLRGATAEEIAQQYPTLELPDVYATISYCLQNTDEVNAYLDKRMKHAQAVKAENRKRFDQSGIRERLLARKL